MLVSSIGYLASSIWYSEARKWNGSVLDAVLEKPAHRADLFTCLARLFGADTDPVPVPAPHPGMAGVGGQR